jgi:DNA (cytosine-5)-methyltransferase 1
MPTFVEFFAGGGCARLGLGDSWKCLFANDFAAKKVASYRANFGPSEIRLADIRNVEASAIPAADLWWASFPCQDHSIAGRGLGFAGERGSLVFEITRLLDAAIIAGTAPKLLVMENVVGFVRAFEGQDFASVMTALVSAGYYVGAVMMDARDFLPQSRERMMIVAVRNDIPRAPELTAKTPQDKWHSKTLRRSVSRLPAEVSKRWHWWRMPLPPEHGLGLKDMIDHPELPDLKWMPPAKIAELLTKVVGRDAARLEKAKQAGKPVVATIMGARKDSTEGTVRTFTVRTDGIAGCLLCRTKSNRQRLMLIDGERVDIRNLSIRELGRLMGLPGGYKLPASETDAVHLTGDGLVVPVIRWLAAHLLEPLLAGAAARPRTAVVKQPRARAIRQRKEPAARDVAAPGGIKRSTVATTAYFLPEEAVRLHGVAAEMGVSLHEMVIIALDGVLARRGEQPVRRYSARR